jgi:uncharacterized protein (UPF0332 family)
VPDPIGDGIARARQELDAARLLADNGFGAQAVSRAYYAAFYAAEAALLAIGETRSKHSGVVAAFSQFLVRQEGLDQRSGRLLRSLFERRSQAEYEFSVVPQHEAQLALTDAQTVVDSITGWCHRRAEGTGSPA